MNKINSVLRIMRETLFNLIFPALIALHAMGWALQLSEKPMDILIFILFCIWAAYSFWNAYYLYWLKKDNDALIELARQNGFARLSRKPAHKQSLEERKDFYKLKYTNYKPYDLPSDKQ